MQSNNSKIPFINLSIIIVNYNLSKEIENCLRSLFMITENISLLKYEIIIVDNNSPDNDLLEVEKIVKQDNIKFFYLNENIGFGKACNFGFSKSTGKYICFLNPDTTIKENIFSPILALFNNDNSVGIVGPKQSIRPPFFDFSAGFYPNIFFELLHILGIGVFFQGFITYLYTKIKRHNFFEIDWILGAAIFMRAELFKIINGFDKDYFMFFEEVDLCKRVSDLGYKIIYYPSLRIHHIGRVSGKKDYRLYTIRTYSSKDLYLSKHYKSVKKLIMKFLLRAQLFSQIIIWYILFPINKLKSKQKLEAFFYLLKHDMKYENRN